MEMSHAIPGQMTQVTSRARERVVGVLLFLGILGFYLAQIPAFAVPGRWVEMLVSFSGLDPFRPLVRPLWTALMQGLAGLPLPDLALFVNGLSALAGAAVCTLLYASLLCMPFGRMFMGDHRFSEARSAHLLAGVLAALYAAVSQPMVTASTRGDFAGFDLLLLLLAVYPSLHYYRRPANGLIYVSGLMAGLAAAEYPGMLMVLPGLGLWWVLLIWRFQAQAWRHVALASLLAVSVALLVLLGSAYCFSGSDEAAWRGGVTIGQAFVELAKNQVLEAAYSVPKVGWLLLLCVTVGPLVFVVFRPMEETTDLFTQLGIYFFRLVLLALGVIILFELPGAPSRFMNARVLLVAPYLIAGLWFGQLVGYYHGLSLRRPSRVASRLIAMLGMFVMVSAGLIHARGNRTDPLAPVVAFVDQVVAALPDEAYVVTDGTFDASLRLVGHRSGKVMHLINIRRDSRIHSAYYASLMEDLQLRSAAHMGVRVLLTEWINDPSTLTARVAVLTSPHVLPASGFEVFPAGLFYRVSRAENRQSPELMLQQNQEAWSSLPVMDLSAMKTSSAGWQHTQVLQRWLSRLANDLGVALDERQSSGLAREAYEQSLVFWPDNVSASMNVLAQVQEQGDGEQQEVWTARLKEQVLHNPEGLQPAFVRQVSGLVRNPMMSYEAGSLLARSGRLREAVDQARKAAAQLDDSTLSAQLELARLFLRGQRAEESAKILARLLEVAPASQGVHLGLLQVALVRRDFDEAEIQISQLEKLGMDEGRLAYEKAALNRAAGRRDLAKRQFLDLVNKPQPAPDAWLALAQLAGQEKDRELFDKAMAALKKERSYPPGLFLLGEQALAQHNMDEARRYFERIMILDPGNIEALTRLAQLDFDRRNAVSLRNRVAALLDIDPDNSFGHYFAASVHLEAGRLDLAETSLRRSLARSDYDMARNDLAWVLNEVGRSDEAMVEIQRALALNPRNASSWDTLASIQSRQGESAEAELSLEKARQISEQKDPAILLNAAAIYLKNGSNDKARASMAALEKLNVRLSKTLMEQKGIIEGRLNH